MREVLSYNHWVNILSTATSVNEAWNLVKERISAAVEKFVPKAISGSTKQFSVPLDKDLLQQIRKKNSLWRKYLRVKQKQLTTRSAEREITSWVEQGPKLEKLKTKLPGKENETRRDFGPLWTQKLKPELA